MVVVTLQIRVGAKVPKRWYGCDVPAEAQLYDIFACYSDGDYDGVPIPDRYIASSRMLVNKDLKS